jgi:hypothetical protein
MKNKLRLKLITFMLLIGIIPNWTSADGMSDDIKSPYSVLVNGKPVTLYQANVWEPGYVPSYGGPYWFCSFDITGETVVEVTTARPLDKLEVLPESKGVVPKISGQKISLNISKPMQLVVEPDGKNGPLMLFANPPEVNVPKEGDPNVIYYGPGEHNAGAIELTDNQTLYLASGAVVSGGIHAKGKNIKIRGRGIIDGIAWARGKGPTSRIVFLEDCKDIIVEGIIVKDGWIWTFEPRRCDGVLIDNVKIVSARVENGDGLDITNSRNVTVTNSFIRSDDDAIAPKGMVEPGKGMPVENLTIENCVLWSDRAHVWRLGAECDAEYFRNLVFKNIDVLHFPDLWTYDEVPFCISLEPANELPIENVLFQDIRIRTNGQKGFIDLRPKMTVFAGNRSFGSISNVIFRNIAFSGPRDTKPGMIRVSGPEPNHAVAQVLFENVTFNGELITAASPNVTLMGSTQGVSFTGAKVPSVALGTGMDNMITKTPSKHSSIQLAEVCKPRGVLYAEGGNNGQYKDIIKRFQQGLEKAIKVTLPVSEEPLQAKWDGKKMLIIGDCDLAKKEGLDGTKLPVGGFEIKTYVGGVIIVGNGEGLKKGVDAFLEYFLGYKEGKAVALKTDLVVRPTWLVSK